MTKKHDAICGIIGMIIAVVLYAASVNIGRIENQTIGADFVPKLTAILLFVLSGILFYNGMKQPVSAKKDDFKHNYKGTFLMFILLCLYVAALDTLGFIISSMIFLFFSLLLLTRKEEVHYVRFVIISVVGSVVISFLFTEVFGVNLPAGILG